MKIDGLVREGWRSVSGMRGDCALHMLNHQWASVGGVICIRGGGGGDVTCRMGQEYWAYAGLEDGGQTERVRWKVQ